MSDPENQFRKYSYRDVVWIGPVCEKLHPSIAVENTNQKQIDEIYSKVYERANNNKKEFIFYTFDFATRYVIHSTYLTQELHGGIIGPPRSFEECFQVIMGFLADEISLIKSNHQHKTYGDGMVETCLDCHTILPFQEN